jgi:hypothetical protein
MLIVLTQGHKYILHHVLLLQYKRSKGRWPQKGKDMETIMLQFEPWTGRKRREERGFIYYLLPHQPSDDD